MKRFAGLLSVLLILSLLLAGCGKATGNSDSPSSSASAPTEPADPPPEKVPVAMYSALQVNFQADAPVEMAVTYGEASITVSGTYTDGYSFKEVIDYRGNLLSQHIDGPDGYFTEYTFTYDESDNNTSYTASSSSEPPFSAEMTYDDKGNVLTAKYSDGTNWQNNSFTYDGNGNTLTEIYADSDGLNSTITYAYDTDGNMLSETYFEDSAVQQSTLYTYDADGNMLTKTVSAGDYSEKTSYTWDAGNLAIEYYSDSDDYWHYYIYTYNADGLTLSESYTDSEGSSYDLRFFYDADDNHIRTNYLSSQATYAENYTYDASGNILTAIFEDDYIRSQTTYTYDDAGQLTERNYSDTDGGYDKALYTYDENGNLISYSLYDIDDCVIESASYTYTYVEMDAHEAEAREKLMSQLFGTFLPSL